jgi:tetratricopeptide (TPR) repeat protein
VELPERPSADFLQQDARSIHIKVVPGGMDRRLSEVQGAQVVDSGGKWYVAFDLTCDMIPFSRILHLELTDEAKVYAPAVSGQFATFEENLPELLGFAAWVYVRYHRFTVVAVANEGVQADFYIDKIRLGAAQRSVRVYADPAAKKSAQSVSIRASGYHPVNFELQSGGIGSFEKIPVLLVSERDHLMFERLAYFYQKGCLVEARERAEELGRKAGGAWGAVELYQGLALYDTGDKEQAFALVRSAARNAETDRDFLLQAEAGLVMAEMRFAAREYQEIQTIVEAALKALDSELGIYGYSRMIPPLSTPLLRYDLKFCSLAARSELARASGASDEIRNLRNEWLAFEDETNMRVPDAAGTGAHTTNPYSKRLADYAWVYQR